MKRKSFIIIGLAVAALAAAMPVSAQNPQAPMRQRVRQNLATLRLLRLTQALDLTDGQTAKIFPAVTRIEKEKFDLQAAMSADIRDLRQMLAEPAPKEPDIAAKVKKIKAAQDSVRQKDLELDAFLESALTPVQKAKYVLFEIEWYRLLEQSLGRMQQGRGNAPPAAPIKK